MLKIKIVSDLHLEFSDIDIKNNNASDVLILSGDILIAIDMYHHPSDTISLNLGAREIAAARFRGFLKRCSENYPHVIYIAGNHEFYHGKWGQTLTILREECSKFNNVYFLENDIKKIDDVTFIGCTLWTDMNKGDPLTLHTVRDYMNDYRVILHEQRGYTKLKPEDTVIRHRYSLGYIKTIVQEKHDEKFVVVGHHAPSKLSTHPKYQNDGVVNGAYSSDLSNFILDHPQIKIWTHGHTHHVFDYLIGTTRIVCNPRGYAGYEEDSGWDMDKLIEI